jgi:hypothetical protein
VDLLAAWVLFPAVALAACLGVGLLIERLNGAPLPGALLAPLGMAGVIALTQLTTRYDVTAEATLPLLVIAALAGWVLGASRRPLRPDRWAAAAALGVFAVFAAPVVLSGEATFAGYTVLGDTSIHFIGADALLRLGRDFGALPPSSYEYSLQAYYGANGYPSGGPTAVGALTSLVHLDVAWTFQPFLALLVVFMGLALWSLAGGFVESRPLRAAVVFVASQPALVLAYALQGSVKEVGAVFAVTLIGALIPVYVAQAPGGWRRAVPLAVACAAAIAIVGLAAGVWLAPLMAGAVVATWFTHRLLPWAAAIAFVVGTAVLSYQMLFELTQYVEVAGGVVTSQVEVGNLLGPLDKLQKFGIWLVGDYRYRPTGTWTETQVLIGVVVGAMALGTIHLIRRRAWAPALYVGVSLLGYLYVVRRGSPWADGKALMIVSPAIMLLAALGAGLLWDLRRRVAAWGLIGIIGAGVLWSNALAYHDVSNAPRDRMAELRDIGERFDGQGPTLYPEFEEFAKHFLRQAAPEGPTEGWQRRYGESLGRDGQLVRQGFSVDLDRFTDEYMGIWRTIVARRGFASSRPPSYFKRLYRGEFYEVWQRAPGAERRTIEHLSLGTFRNPVAAPPCPQLGDLAHTAELQGGMLAFAERAQTVLAGPASAQLPRGWFVDQADREAVHPFGAGTLSMPISTPRAGRYSVWLEGSFGRGVDVRIDGKRVGEVAYRLNGRGSAEHVATVELGAGEHTVSLVRGGGSLRPGNGGSGMRLIGPVALTEADPTGRPVRRLAPGRWRELCGRQLDWVEAVRG